MFAGLLGALGGLGGAAKAVGAVAGGIGALKGKKGGKLNLGRLRREAVANGFHPLTVLEATGGQGFHTPEKLPVMSIIGQTVGTIADQMQTAEQIRKDDEYQDAQMRVLDAQASRLSAPVLSSNPTKTMQKPSYEGKTWNEIPYVQVFTPDGKAFDVKANIAERLRLKAGDVWMAEDNEALIGEIGGEIYGIGTLTNDMLFNGKDGAQPVFKGLRSGELPQESPEATAGGSLRTRAEDALLSAPREAWDFVVDKFSGENVKPAAPPLTTKDPAPEWRGPMFGWTTAK